MHLHCSLKCFAFLNFQHQNENDAMILIALICEMLWSFASAYVACEFGQQVSDAFTGIDCVVKQFDWYLFPIKTQKILPTIMVVTQKPVSLNVFGNLLANRERFKEVSEIRNILQRYTCADCTSF